MQAAPTGSDGENDDVAIFTEINITPLTDVFLVLLIIFMVVASSVIEVERSSAATKGLLSERALQIQTPQGSGDTALVPKDIVISVKADGTLFVESEELNLDTLQAKLSEMKKGSTSTRVVIRGDEAASYQTVMQVIAKARSAGLSDVALASRPSQ